MDPSSKALYTRQVDTYLKALERGDVAAICALFTPDARIYSPFLGWMQPTPFFEKSLRHPDKAASRRSTSASARPARRATGYFVRLGLKDGSAVQFECVDVFEFDESGRVERMVIVYDTHPVREVVGDKYA